MSDADSRLRVFVDLFNIAYPDWAVRGRSDRRLKPHHVDFEANLRSYHGRCGAKRNGLIYYRVNAADWAEWNWPRRIGLMIHEMSHIKTTSHSPEFWEEVVDNHLTLERQAEEVEEVVGHAVDWDSVREHTVTSPHNGMVDSRVETAYERQLKLADALGYPKEKLPPFNGMTIYSVAYTTDDCIDVHHSDVEYASSSVEELVDFFHRRPRPGVSFSNGAYHVEPPKATRTGDGYEVIEGHERAALVKKAIIDKSESREELAVEIVDGEGSVDTESGN